MNPKKSRRQRPRKKKSNKKLVLIIGFLAVIGLIAVVVAFTGWNNSRFSSGPIKVRIETSMGDLIIELREDMPITTGNFVDLVQQGIYDNTIFHRVVNLPGNLVIIQGGDPTGTGLGDPSISSIPDEFSETPENNENRRGTIAMANKGMNFPNSGSSQFFISGEYNSHLDNLHPVFGDVLEGMDVVDEILNVQTDENDKPVDDVILIAAQLVE